MKYTRTHIHLEYNYSLSCS